MSGKKPKRSAFFIFVEQLRVSSPGTLYYFMKTSLRTIIQNCQSLLMQTILRFTKPQSSKYTNQRGTLYVDTDKEYESNKTNHPVEALIDVKQGASTVGRRACYLAGVFTDVDLLDSVKITRPGSKIRNKQMKTICTAGFLLKSNEGKFAIVTVCHGHSLKGNVYYGTGGIKLGICTYSAISKVCDIALVEVDNPSTVYPFIVLDDNKTTYIKDYYKGSTIALLRAENIYVLGCRLGRAQGEITGVECCQDVNDNDGKFYHIIKGAINIQLIGKTAIRGDSGGAVIMLNDDGSSIVVAIVVAVNLCGSVAALPVKNMLDFLPESYKNMNLVY